MCGINRTVKYACKILTPGEVSMKRCGEHANKTIQFVYAAIECVNKFLTTFSDSKNSAKRRYSPDSLSC